MSQKNLTPAPATVNVTATVNAAPAPATAPAPTSKLSNTQKRKGQREIESLTGTLKQTLQLFMGLYGTRLESCGGMTVREYMAARGVFGSESGSGRFKGYKCADIFAAWHSKLMETTDKGTTCYLWKKVTAKYTRVVEGEDKPEPQPVYTYENALEVCKGRRVAPITRYAKVPVKADRWSMKTIFDGLNGFDTYDKDAEKAEKADEAWNVRLSSENPVAYIVVNVDGMLRPAAVPAADVKF